MAANTAREARLDLRVPENVKMMINRAASTVGLTTSAFILTNTIEKAEAILKSAQLLELNKAEHENFLRALNKPPKPNKKLTQLFEKYGK